MKASTNPRVLGKRSQGYCLIHSFTAFILSGVCLKYKYRVVVVVVFFYTFNDSWKWGRIHNSGYVSPLLALVPVCHDASEWLNDSYANILYDLRIRSPIRGFHFLIYFSFSSETFGMKTPFQSKFWKGIGRPIEHYMLREPLRIFYSQLCQLLLAWGCILTRCALLACSEP